MKHCSSCGAKLELYDNFCQNCGTPAADKPVYCRICGAQMTRDADKCPSCGATARFPKAVQSGTGSSGGGVQEMDADGMADLAVEEVSDEIFGE